MKKLFFLLIFCSGLVIQTLAQDKHFDFELGVSQDSLKGITVKKNMLMVIGRAKIVDGFQFLYNNIEFSCGLDSSRHVVYYSTIDNKFLINGFPYLTTNRHLIDSVVKAEGVKYSMQFGAYIDLENDWKLGFSATDLKYKKEKVVLKKKAIPMRLFKIDKEYI